MMKMLGYFDELRAAIEPEKKRKEQAQKADDPVREHLETHKSFAHRHVSTFLYGSYKRNTAEGNIKDVDIVVGRQHDLVDIVHRLTPIITLKGDSRARED